MQTEVDFQQKRLEMGCNAVSVDGVKLAEYLLKLEKRVEALERENETLRMMSHWRCHD
jgi:hypothetical protein